MSGAFEKWFQLRARLSMKEFAALNSNWQTIFSCFAKQHLGGAGKAEAEQNVSMSRAPRGFLGD